MLERNKVYLLSKHDFLLLAAAAGMKGVYGFELDVESLERGDSIQILQDLTARKYMQVVDGKFVPVNEMAEIFGQIKEAETTLEVRKSSGKKCIVYIYDEGVLVSPSMRRKDMFEVMMMDKAQIWQHLQDEGWIA